MTYNNTRWATVIILKGWEVRPLYTRTSCINCFNEGHCRALENKRRFLWSFPSRMNMSRRSLKRETIYLTFERCCEWFIVINGAVTSLRHWWHHYCFLRCFYVVIGLVVCWALSMYGIVLTLVLCLWSCAYLIWSFFSKVCHCYIIVIGYSFA